jgi:hypothetical protein
VMSTLIGSAMATVTPSDTTVFSTVVAGLLVLVTHKLARQNVSWHAPMVLLAFVSLSLPPSPPPSPRPPCRGSRLDLCADSRCACLAAAATFHRCEPGARCGRSRVEAHVNGAAKKTVLR